MQITKDKHHENKEKMIISTKKRSGNETKLKEKVEMGRNESTMEFKSICIKRESVTDCTDSFLEGRDERRAVANFSFCASTN